MKFVRWLLFDLLGLRGIFLLFVIIALGVPSVLFWFQNAATRVDLFLRLTPSMGWYLAQDAPVPALIGIGLAIGFVLPVLFFSVLQLQKGRQLKVLKRQVTALQDELELARQAAERRVAAAEAAVLRGGDESSSAGDASGDEEADEEEAAPTDTGNFDDLI